MQNAELPFPDHAQEERQHLIHSAPFPTVALSIRQPWAWLILHAGKDIENRTWHTARRGRILIHASKGMTRSEYEEARERARHIRQAYQFHGMDMPPFEALPRGGIVGAVDLAGCVMDSPSPWFFGPCGLVLRNPQELPFMECKGQLGFFTVTYHA